MADPIRIFIGTEPKTMLACKVLEFSILRHASRPIQFTRMIGPEWEYSLEGIKVGTGFSLRRWMIPERGSWQGKAIYIDADQLVFDDILELWLKDTTASRRDGLMWCSYQPDKFSKEPWPQTSVMLIDCEAAKGRWGFDLRAILEHLKSHPTQKDYADFMHARWCVDKVVRIGDEWNHLNRFVPRGKPKHTRLLHYTKENEQPWYNPKHPLSHLWQKELELSIRAGVVTKSDIEHGLSRWGKKEDWRPTNGLHPFYKKYLSLF